jgi:hypothetical protein
VTVENIKCTNTSGNGTSAVGIYLAHIMDRIEILSKTKEVSKMAWGIMITTVMLFGMLGLAMLEATTVHEVSTKPEVDRDAGEKEVKKAA